MKILTDEEIKNVFLETFVDDSALTEAEWTAARAIEAAIIERIGEPVARTTIEKTEWISQGDGTWIGRIESHIPLDEITPLVAIRGVE